MSFQAMKFNTSTINQRAQIQLALFAAGYGWASSGKELNHLDKQFYFTDKLGNISFSDPAELEYFERHSAVEMDLKSTHTFTPHVKPATVVIQGKEYVLSDIVAHIHDYEIKPYQR